MKKQLFLTLLCLLASIGSAFADDVKMKLPVNGTFDNDGYGWTNQNMGFQSSSYTNEDASIDRFMERWTWAGWGGLDRGLIQQTYVLPQGNYMLECDAIATNQNDAALNIYGANLFAIMGQDTICVAVSTRDGAPEHYSLEFTADGVSPVSLGFGVFENTNANWIAVDNIAMTMLNAAPITLLDAIKTVGKVTVTPLNDEQYPWFNYDQNRIYPGNWQHNTTGLLTFEITAQEPVTFNMDYSMPNGSNYWNRTYVHIDDVQELERWNYWDPGFEGSVSYTLPEGTHRLTVNNTYADGPFGYYISNISVQGLSSQIMEITLGQAGDLGLELIAAAGNLMEVKYLKINGPMNSDDWTTINSLSNLVYLDMSEAKVTDIPNDAFSRNNQLVGFKCPVTLKTIGNSAFNSTALRGIEFNEGLESIGNSAFNGRKLTTIDLPSTLKTIGESAFRSTIITSLTLPVSVESLGNYAFYDCNQLKSVRLNSTLTELPYRCFYSCEQMEIVTGGENVTTVGEYCFYDGYKLKSLPDLKPVQVYNYAFQYSHALESFDFSRTVSVGYCSFQDCDSMRVVDLPVINSMDHYAFQYCDKLEKVIVGPSLPKFNSNTFYQCPVKEIYLCQPAAPDRYDSGNQPFYFNEVLYNSATLYVPEYAMTSYKLHEYWSQFTNYEVNPLKVSDITVNGALTLTSNARIPDAPNLTLKYVGNANASLTVNGTAEQVLGDYVQFNRQYDNGNSSLISRSANMTSTSTAVRYYLEYNYYNYWYYICLPFDVKVGDITSDNGASLAICRYDGAGRAQNGAGNSWVRMTDDDILKAGQGYIYCVSQTTTINLPATAETHNQMFLSTAATTPLEENASELASDGGWNLVGNSYPSYYDIYYMDYTAPITMWNTGNRTFTAYSVADDQIVLHPFEAFFVQKPAGVDNLVLNPQGRQINNVVQQKNAAPAKAKAQSNRLLVDLTLTGAEVTDRTRIVINPEASDAFEAESDASKMMSYEAPQIYTQRGDELYAINEGAQKDGQVAISLYLPEEGDYTLDALRQDFPFTLTDNGMDVELPYTFHASEGTLEGRFVLYLNASDVDALQTVSAQASARQSAFDLQGRRAQKTDKGVYIINNKKVVK